MRSYIIDTNQKHVLEHVSPFSKLKFITRLNQYKNYPSHFNFYCVAL